MRLPTYSPCLHPVCVIGSASSGGSVLRAPTLLWQKGGIHPQTSGSVFPGPRAPAPGSCPALLPRGCPQRPACPRRVLRPGTAPWPPALCGARPDAGRHGSRSVWGSFWLCHSVSFYVLMQTYELLISTLRSQSVIVPDAASNCLPTGSERAPSSTERGHSGQAYVQQLAPPRVSHVSVFPVRGEGLALGLKQEPGRPSFGSGPDRSGSV